MNTDALQVCVNGHKITEFFHWIPEERKDFCDLCEVKTPTIYQCTHCKREIPGNSHAEHSAGAAEIENVPVPKSCKFCGEPFPWTVKRNQPDYYQMAYDAREREKEVKRRQQLQVMEVIARSTIDPMSISSASQLARLEEERTKLLQATSLALEPMPSIQPVHNTINNFHGSQVIQNSPGANQTVTIGRGDSMEVIKQLIPMLTQLASTANLNATLAADLVANIQTLEAQIKLSKPNQTVLKGVLVGIWDQIKTIPAGVVSGLIVEKLKPFIGL